MMKNIVCFHIGRGGKGNLPGYYTYQKDLHSFKDCLKWADKKGDIFVDDFDFEKNKPLPDSKWRVKDCDGNTLLAGRKTIDCDEGVLDIDGYYDTYVAKKVELCHPNELQAIIRDGVPTEHEDKETFEYALGMLGLVHTYGSIGPEVRNRKAVIAFKTSQGELVYALEPYQGMSGKEIMDDLMRDDQIEFTIDSVKYMAEKISDACREFERFSLDKSETNGMWTVTDIVTGVKLTFEEHNLNKNQEAILPEDISPEDCSHSMMLIGEWLAIKHPELI